MDPRIIGFWRIREVDVIQNRMVKEIGGGPGDVAEFTVAGKYIVRYDSSEPMDYQCRCHDTDPPGLDVWVKGLEGLTTKCVYDITGTELRVCIAGKDWSEPRPTEVRRDDKRLWLVKIFERCAEPPPAKRRRSRGGGWRLKPGKLIPEGFLAEDESRKQRERKASD